MAKPIYDQSADDFWLVYEYKKYLFPKQRYYLLMTN